MNSHSPGDVQSRSGQLEQAFEMFNELSERLSASYRELESRVAWLSAELAEARNERLKQLGEKELLATRLEGLLDALPGGVIVLDSAGIIMQANPVAHDMLGQDLAGQCWQTLANRMFSAGEDELRLHDGRWISLSVRELEAGRGRILLLADVSETRELQQQLNRKARLTSLGEMVASLAHQLRTPLTAALLHLSTLTHPRTRTDDIPRIAEKTGERLRHLERMIGDMLIFARGDTAELDFISIEQLVSQLHGNLDELFAASGVALHINNHADSRNGIRANRDALLSALQNLADNAHDAILARVSRLRDNGIELGGELAIDIRLDHAEVVIAFRDNGSGMAGSVIERALEPFYTTKSGGIGLGLAVVNACVESFQGRLVMSSSEGAGSCVCVHLPRARHQGVLPSGIVQGNNDDNQEQKEVMV